MEIFTSILGAIGSGGLTGLIGGALTFFKERSASKLRIEEMKLKHAHEQVMADRERELMAMEADKDIRIAEADASALEAKAHYEALSKGYQLAASDVGNTEREGVVLRFIEGARRFVRPAASYYAMVVLTLVTVWVINLWQDMGLAMTPDQAFTLSMQMLHAVVYICSSILLWWFSTRGVRMGGK